MWGLTKIPITHGKSADPSLSKLFLPAGQVKDQRRSFGARLQTYWRFAAQPSCCFGVVGPHPMRGNLRMIVGTAVEQPFWPVLRIES